MQKPGRFIRVKRNALALALVVVPMSTTLIAQDPIPVPAQVVQGGAFGLATGIDMPSKEKLGGAKQFHLLSIYAMEIRRLDAAVKLEDAQKTKLSVGAKGLAKKKSQQFVKTMMEMGLGAGMPGGGAVPAAPPKHDEPDIKFVEVKSFTDIDANTKQMLDGGFLPEGKPYEDADWLKLVKSILKPEQTTKYEQVIAANKLRTDKAMVDAGVAELSLEMGLTNDQQSKLKGLVLEQITKNEPRPSNLLSVSLQIEGKQFTMELAKVENTLLRDALTPQQFELISLKLDNLKNMLNQMPAEMLGLPAEGN